MKRVLKRSVSAKREKLLLEISGSAYLLALFAMTGIEDADSFRIGVTIACERMPLRKIRKMHKRFLKRVGPEMDRELRERDQGAKE